MPNYTEKDIQNAIQDIEAGLSQRQAARVNGVPRSTLGTRIEGITTRLEAHEHKQKLAPGQEKYLVD